jgi:stage II sporulation protein M
MNDYGIGGARPEKPRLAARLAAGLRDFYGNEWAMWKAHYKKYFLAAARVLGLGFIFGFLVFMARPDLEKEAMAFVMRSIRDIPLGAKPPELALQLFNHNARASALAVAAGIVPFACLPILDPFVNGATLGLLASISKHHGLNVPLLFLRSVAPHGIVELPAVLYATSVGVYLSLTAGRMVLAAWRKKKRAKDDDRRASDEPPDSRDEGFLQSYPERSDSGAGSLAGDVVRSFMLVVLPLLAVAALIEAFVTPLLR